LTEKSIRKIGGKSIVKIKKPVSVKAFTQKVARISLLFIDTELETIAET